MTEQKHQRYQDFILSFFVIATFIGIIFVTLYNDSKTEIEVQNHRKIDRELIINEIKNDRLSKHPAKFFRKFE